MWSALAGAESAYGPTPESRLAGERAFAVRGRVTAPSRFQIENIYYVSVTGEQVKACSSAAQWVNAYPDDFAAHHNLLVCLSHEARVDQALAESRENVRFFQESPFRPGVQFDFLPAVRAAIELQQDNPLQAIDVLRPALDYEFADPAGINNMYPSYLRGLAYLQLHQARQAAAEFQKLIDHPGIVWRNVIGALTRLQMARA